MICLQKDTENLWHCVPFPPRLSSQQGRTGFRVSIFQHIPRPTLSRSRRGLSRAWALLRHLARDAIEVPV